MKRTFNSFLALPLFVLMLVSISSLTANKVYATDGPFQQTPSNVKAVRGPGAGEVTLYWNEAPYANSYSVSYGKASMKYEYGALHIGNNQARSYTVKALTPGVKYYFAVVANRDNVASKYSMEVSAVAGGTYMASQTTRVGGPSISYEMKAVKKAVIHSQSKQLWASPGPGLGQVTVGWNAMSSADNYHIVYGTKMGQYEYGALNLGNTRSFTVGHLVSGKAYYFAIVPVLNNRALYTTSAVMAYAMGGDNYVHGAQVVQTKAENLIQPVVQPKLEVQVDPPAEAIGGVNQEVMPTEAIPAGERNDGGTVQGVMDQAYPTEAIPYNERVGAPSTNQDNTIPAF